ncbi:Serine/threonine-protein kinase Atg1 [Paramicrosporidium saccamoebae]|uniref:Serine/threonine-protein kinase Atg1 n=1 Tax=Paramicrosporidium saccamoebae TaxID=1246581 RepID=A0A2H9TMQ8_9FUNG|nr:Serine/threonine-protein kinase Atg1 [Paramicrosporidium saccamoebae]
MLRWFSIRRIFFWVALFTVILVSLVWTGKQLARVGDGHRHGRAGARKHDTVLAARKAKLRMSQQNREEVKEPPTKNTAPKDTDMPKNEKKRTLSLTDGEELEEAKPVIIPQRTRTAIEASFLRPFQMKHTDIKAAFEQFKNTTRTMESYLWDQYRIVALPASIKDKNGKNLRPITRFTKSIIRHVSIFYGEYLMRGGTETRHFGVPVCREIGLGESDGHGEGQDRGENEEYQTKELSRLAGSQGDLFFKEVPYTVGGVRGPFSLNEKGNVQLVSKHFKVKNPRKDGKKEHVSQEERDVAFAKRIFGREHYALSTVAHRGVIQPVCYEKEPTLRMIYPFLKGGDLVTLSSDHLSFYAPAKPRHILKPDETFLPRFFRQLVETIYAIHQQGILHLDLKPENFVISGPDRNFILPSDSPALSDYSLVLLDFGLAMRLDEVKEKDCIHVGTDVTMAPEQHICRPAGRGSDWWSVAAGMWRTRVFWEPSITDDQRDEILDSRCAQWGHYVYPTQPFFHPEFSALMDLMLKPRVDDRDFSADRKSLNKLLDSPYLLRGLDPQARRKRMAELAAAPANTTETESVYYSTEFTKSHTY